MQNTPRLQTLAMSAPKYDEVTKPKIAPIPAACIASKTKCTCYTQQGTKLQTDDYFCRNIVENGFFLDFFDESAANKNANNPIVVNPNPQPIAQQTF